MEAYLKANAPKPPEPKARKKATPTKQSPVPEKAVQQETEKSPDPPQQESIKPHPEPVISGDESSPPPLSDEVKEMMPPASHQKKQSEIKLEYSKPTPKTISINEATDLAIKSNFDPMVTGSALMSLAELEQGGIEKAIAFAAIVAKAKQYRTKGTKKTV